MVTGFNTDVEHDGKIYHVQTEDRGKSLPVIESLVYCAGEIMGSHRYSYAELVGSEKCSDAELLRRMEDQHRKLIREIQNGKFDTGHPKPFGHSIVTNRSLDEVVVDYLREHFTVEQIQLKMTGPKILRAGASPKLKLEVKERNTERPVCGATVVVKLITHENQPRELFTAPTDERGTVEAAFAIPRLSGDDGVLLCRADAGGKTAEIKRSIKRHSATP